MADNRCRPARRDSISIAERTLRATLGRPYFDPAQTRIGVLRVLDLEDFVGVLLAAIAVSFKGIAPGVVSQKLRNEESVWEFCGHDAILFVAVDCSHQRPNINAALA